MNKTTQLWIAIGCIFLLLAVIIFVSTKISRDSSKGLIEKPNSPQEEWWRSVDVETKKESTVTVVNKFDGYQIKVPNDWYYDEEFIEPIGGFLAHTLPKNNFAPFINGTELRVLVFYTDLNISDWLNNSEDSLNYFPEYAEFIKRNHPAGNAYKASYQISAHISWLEPGSTETPQGIEVKEGKIQNSLAVEYLISKNNKIFLLSCKSAGKNYLKFIEDCEEYLQTFSVLK